MFLKPLRRQLEDMEQYDFTEIEKILPALMHTIGLIWANSKFYCRPSRIIVLLQEMCNMLIEMVRVMRLADGAHKTRAVVWSFATDHDDLRLFTVSKTKTSTLKSFLESWAYVSEPVPFTHDRHWYCRLQKREIVQQACDETAMYIAWAFGPISNGKITNVPMSSP